jgi:hypothetical protein
MHLFSSTVSFLELSLVPLCDGSLYVCLLHRMRHALVVGPVLNGVRCFMATFIVFVEVLAVRYRFVFF